jgi:protein O-mannosyl-transferase
MSPVKMKSRPRTRPARASESSNAWRVAGQFAAIVAGVWLVYLPALRAGFVWDDELLITANSLLHTVSGLREIWSFGRTADYFPLTNTIFWIEWHLFGRAAAGYHAVNILLQTANALLLWLVLRRLELPGAWLAALIFGIHPVHAESVAWISELKNLLAMFWALLSVWFFLGPSEQSLVRRRAAYIASFVCFVLALLSKTQVVFLPVVLLLCVWWRSSNRGITDSVRPGPGPSHRSSWFYSQIVRTLPFFLVAIAFGLITIWFQTRGIGEEEVVLGPFSRRLTNAAMGVWWYAKQVFVPVRLMTVYPRWRFDFPELVEWLPLIALTGVMAFLWFWRGRWKGGLFFAFAYFIVALLPVVGLLRMSYPRSGTLVADHLQYFADISLIALFSAGTACLLASRRREIRIASRVFVFLLLGAMGSYTWARTKVYRNEETLWQDNFSKNPDAWQGHNRIGQLFFNQGKFAEAGQHFERAVELKPELADNYNQLGLTYCRLNRFEEGIAEYRKGLRLKEEKSSTANTTAAAIIRTNLANALTITGNNLNNLAQRLSEEGAVTAAEANRKRAMDRYEEAISEYEKALEIAPEHPAIHRNLGVLLASLGRNHEAIAHLQKALQLAPNEPLARETLDAIEAQRP